MARGWKPMDRTALTKIDESLGKLAELCEGDGEVRAAIRAVKGSPNNMEGWKRLLNLAARNGLSVIYDASGGVQRPANVYHVDVVRGNSLGVGKPGKNGERGEGKWADYDYRTPGEIVGTLDISS